MNTIESVLTIAICVAGTMFTRFISFIVFSEKKEPPKYVKYLGDVLPLVLFGMLVVYCFRSVDFVSSQYHGIPELLAAALTAVLHVKWKNMLVSIAGGTICYMLLVQFVFI